MGFNILIMKLSISKTKSATNLYVSKSFREGKKTSSKIVEKLGTYEELEKKLNGIDPIEWAKAYIKDLNEKEKEDRKDVNIRFSPSTTIEMGESQSFNVGYLFLQQIYYELGLNKICKDITKKYKFDFNLNSILSRLVYSRILFPASKLSTYEESKKYIEQPEFELHHIYRSLDILAKESNHIQASLYKNSIKNNNTRQTGVIYYDCTNYYFEIEEAKGIKQFGVSKEHRPNPIVQMGLFMDADGFPLAFDINPGNTNEQITLKPLEKRLNSDFGLSKFVVCTDAGLSSTDNRKYNMIGGRAFITTQSLKKLKSHLKEWALSCEGWKIVNQNDDTTYNLKELNPDNDYSRTTFYKDRFINEDGVEQRMIVTYSIKYKEYIHRKRQQQIERAEKLIKTNSITLNSKRSTDCKRFIKKTTCTKEGEVCEHELYNIDLNRIVEEQQYDGFYAICTNLESDVEGIIKINHQRWEIEESFRIMKSEFKARPVYLQNDERIKAHFLTCFIALMLLRKLENKLKYKHSSESIIKALANMNMLKIRGEGYIPTYTRSAITDHLHIRAEFRTDNQIIISQKMKKILSLSKKSK